MRPYLIVSLFLAVALARAADPLPGHSSHGEAFNDGPRQAAVLIPGCGKVDFPVTAKTPEVQTFFNQGVAQLHGFWYYEAERSFRQAAALDENCAMAYWGMAMANVNNDKRAKEFTAKAVGLKSRASEREKLWIVTLETFYKDDKRDKKQRALDFIRDLETIVHEHPMDVEAKAFLAWKIWHARDLAPISSPQAVDSLLDQVFAANPDHPAHHYRIHLWDGVKPVRALKSAATNGQNAPGIAHMWHMPGHTFSKLKRFDDAAWQQEASTRVDHAYMMRNFVLPDQIHNYAHNEEWLIRTFNDLGRAHDAIGLAKSLIAIPRHPTYNSLDKANTSAGYGRTRLLETLVKWELWEDLIQLTNGATLGAVTADSQESGRLHAMGIAQYHLDQPEDLARTISALEAHEKKIKEKATAAEKKKDTSKKGAAPPAATASGAKAKDAATTKTPANGSAKPAANEPKTPGPVAVLHALQAVLKKDEAAARRLTNAKDMPKELLAQCWLRLNDPKKAEALVKDFADDLPGKIAKAEVLSRCGKKDEAKKAFEAVRAAAFAMDPDLPAAKRLAELAQSFSITGDWRGAAPKRDDSGKRPALETLGPIHWHPPVAPRWKAMTLEGQPVADAGLGGKPHILLFYLGSACTHCVEQLAAFAKAASEFDKAGINLAGISPEEVSVAKRISERMPDKKALPFPVFSDPSLAAFKAFRAYDDFEHEPLHAVVLIDADGNLRWIDIGADPFTNTSFLLEEARRLLAMPVH